MAEHNKQAELKAAAKRPRNSHMGWPRRAVLMASCASLIFVSGCQNATQLGDQRWNNGSLRLNASESTRAAMAAQIFASVGNRRAPPADIQNSAAAERRLQTVAARYRGRDNVSPTEEAELLAAARPVIVAHALEEARRGGEAAYAIPAHSVRSLTFPVYCLDRHAAAPSAGEEMQLVSADTIFPSDLLPLYHGLLHNASQAGPRRDDLAQGLIWNLRQFATGDSQNPVALSPAQEQALQNADPNGMATFERYAQRAMAQQLGNKLLKEGIDLVLKQAGHAAPRLGSLIRTSDVEGLLDVRQTTRNILSQRSSEPMLDSDQGYTLLTPDLAAHATSLAGLSGVHVDVANAADGLAVFQPGACIAQSARHVQREGIQTNAAASPDSRRRASINSDPLILDALPVTLAASFLPLVGGEQSPARVQLVQAIPFPLPLPPPFIPGRSRPSPVARQLAEWTRDEIEMLRTLGLAYRLASKFISHTAGQCSNADAFNNAPGGNPPTLQAVENANRPPTGSKPIDQTAWSGDHPEIKHGVGAGPNDNVSISPDGEVWSQNPDGTWTNNGPASDYTGSGSPSGRRGRDRDRK